MQEDAAQVLLILSSEQCSTSGAASMTDSALLESVRFLVRRVHRVAPPTRRVVAALLRGLASRHPYELTLLELTDRRAGISPTLVDLLSDRASKIQKTALSALQIAASSDPEERNNSTL